MGWASPLGIEIVILDSSTKRLFLLYSRQPSQPRLIRTHKLATLERILSLWSPPSFDNTTYTQQRAHPHTHTDQSDLRKRLSHSHSRIHRCRLDSQPSLTTQPPHTHTHISTTTMGSVVLPHLASGWHVDQAIMSEEDRLVVIRFGRDWDKDCMRQDEVLYRIADRVKNFAVIYVCDLDQVPDFNQMYELYDPMTIMFFFRNKHMMCDFGTGNNNKLNWVLEDKQELIDIIETIYRGAKKGRGLVVSPKDYSTRYRY